MKKIIFFLIIISIFMIPKVKAVELIPNATSGILIENETGEIIYEKDKNKKVSVASMTKMVAQIIILENIQKQNLNWDDVITISKKAQEMGGSQIYLQAGEKMTVRDLFKGVSMASANDATVQFAITIAGDEKKFVELMNKKVRALGLKNTHFKNCTGLDEKDHYSTAYDMAVIARELLKYEDILKYSSVYEDYLRQNTDNKFWLVNTNKLVRLYEGTDGLKTGFTDDAKYCIAVTIKKNNMRLIAIVLGEESSKVRNEETIELLEYGYNTKKAVVLYRKGDIIKNIETKKANKSNIRAISSGDIIAIENKNSKSNKYTTKINIKNFTLPVKKGYPIGNIEILSKDEVVAVYDLVSKDNVGKMGYLKLFLNTLKKVIVGSI